MSERISVVIAAKDAEGTIAAAIRSALIQDEVTSVMVVDDGSTDRTTGAAAAIAQSDRRVRIIQLSENKGPSFARNAAIAQSDEPLIAILDADDCYTPNRFKPLLRHSGWDLIADDVAFVSSFEIPITQSDTGKFFSMDAEQFVVGNISRPGLQRGEYGFLKPVIRRDFLTQHHLSYDETVRLGEDYDLYCRMLLLGAKFKIIEHCGYIALVRPNSLSSQHRTADLERLVRIDDAFLLRDDLDTDVRRAIETHARQTKDKFEHRRFLDLRRTHGMSKAISALGTDFRAWAAVMIAILRDKTTSNIAVHNNADVRYLLRGRTPSTTKPA